MSTQKSNVVSLHDVDYYNKDITKNNKVITKYTEVMPSSFGLVANAPEVNDEVALAVTPSLERSQEREREIEISSETLADEISAKDVKRAVVQLWNNPGTFRQWKLKVRLNVDFGGGEENIDFVCPLNKDWGNFTKYHPDVSKDTMVEWAREQRSVINKELGCKPYLGKMHESQGWSKKGQNFNQNEPYSAAIVWYNPDEKLWYALVRIYAWEEIFVLSRDGLTVKQANCKGQKIWMNPMHYTIQRPQTWAQRRKGRK